LFDWYRKATPVQFEPEQKSSECPAEKKTASSLPRLKAVCASVLVNPALP